MTTRPSDLESDALIDRDNSKPTRNLFARARNLDGAAAQKYQMDSLGDTDDGTDIIDAPSKDDPEEKLGEEIEQMTNTAIATSIVVRTTNTVSYTHLTLPTKA